MLSVWKFRFTSFFVFYMYITHVVVFSKENTLQRIRTEPAPLYAIFQKHPFHVLDGEKIDTAYVNTEKLCLLRRAKNLQCFSTNVGVDRGQNRKVLCELLSSDKYSSPDSFQPSPSFHHYSIAVSWLFFEGHDD